MLNDDSPEKGILNGVHCICIIWSSLAVCLNNFILDLALADDTQLQ